MLVTNGRKTTVVQDEIEFREECDAFAAYHYKSSKIKAEISPDRRTCIMTDESGTKLSVRLLSENDGVGFEITDCYTYILDKTANCEGEYSREDYSRLLIRYGKTRKIKSAVVIEILENGDTGYAEIKPISEW